MEIGENENRKVRTEPLDLSNPTGHRLSSQMFQKLFDLSFGDDKKKKPLGFADFGMGQDEQARFCRNVGPYARGGCRESAALPTTVLGCCRWEAPAMRARGQGP